MRISSIDAIALIDANNFYASCEQNINPNLRNKPVVILSNNDGCIIAMMMFPGLAVKLLSTIIKSLSLIPAFIIESPLTLRKKVLNGLDIKCSFKSIFSSV